VLPGVFERHDDCSTVSGRQHEDSHGLLLVVPLQEWVIFGSPSQFPKIFIHGDRASLRITRKLNGEAGRARREHGGVIPIADRRWRWTATV
jgi:hypothetical protein